MPITRREFAQAGMATAALASIGGPAVTADNPLIRRPIPSSGETVPVIGLGTNRYGVGNDKELRVPLRESLNKFHQLGGAVIDTAPGYRSSEQVLGELIGDLGIGKDLFMATKIDRDDRASDIDRMQRSLRLLRVSAIDLMQCHNLIGWEIAIPLLREWKQAGAIRYLGITTSRQRQYGLMEKIMKTHDLDFVQINYSLADQRESAERLLPLAAERGMAVMVNRPFGGGNVFKRLNKMTLPDWAAEFDCDSWSQFLLKYVLSHPAVTCTIPGMTKARHVVDNMAAGSGRMPTADLRRRQEQYFDAL